MSPENGEELESKKHEEREKKCKIDDVAHKCSVISDKYEITLNCRTKE